MLLTLSMVLAMAAETPPPPLPPGERRIETRVVILDGGPDGPARLDADGDGFVSREEYAAPLGRMFDRLDKDHDGKLSTAEMEDAPPPPPGGPMWRPRDTADAPPPPGPGERVEHRVEIRRMGGPDGDLDKNGDGEVSEEEFLAPLREAFRHMDADASGSLEAGERRPGPDILVDRRIEN